MLCLWTVYQNCNNYLTVPITIYQYVAIKHSDDFEKISKKNIGRFWMDFFHYNYGYQYVNSTRDIYHYMLFQQNYCKITLT